MRIFIIGDSTVQYNDISTYPQSGWGQMLSLYLNRDMEIFNFAKNGRSSKSFYNEGLFNEVEKNLRENDLLIIQFGHNDQKPDEERKTEAFTSYKYYLKKYTDFAKSVNAIPILVTPLCRRHFDDGRLMENIHYDYPDAMKQLAKEENIKLIDLYEESRRILMEAGDEKSKKWFMNLKPSEFDNYPLGLEDNTHLNILGAVKFAGVIANELKEFKITVIGMGK